MKSAAQIFKAVEKVQERAQVRTLTLADVEEARSAFLALRRYAKRHGLIAPAVEMDAGGVAKSYRYSGETTQLVISETKIEAKRGYARKVAYGDNGRLRGSVQKPDGVKWSDLPALAGQTWTRGGYLYF